MLSQMSVTELIEQLKALSAREREAFARLFHEMETPTVPGAGMGIRTPVTISPSCRAVV